MVVSMAVIQEKPSWRLLTLRFCSFQCNIRGFRFQQLLHGAVLSYLVRLYCPVGS
jgi:hypothetical protein